MPKPTNIDVQSSAPGAQAEMGLNPPALQVGEYSLELNGTMSMLADQEALFYRVSKDASLVGAEEGQPLTGLHETMISFASLVAKSMRAQGVKLTPYQLSELIPLDQMKPLVERMNAMVGQLPGAEEGNAPGSPASP